MSLFSDWAAVLVVPVGVERIPPKLSGLKRRTFIMTGMSREGALEPFIRVARSGLSREIAVKMTIRA